MAKEITLRIDRAEVEVIVEALRNEVGDCANCEKHDPIRTAADRLQAVLDATNKGFSWSNSLNKYVSIPR